MRSDAALSALDAIRDYYSKPYYVTEGYEPLMKEELEALSFAIRSIEKLESLKEQIAFAKRTMKSENITYMTGYLCALSAVEGMIAEYEHEGVSGTEDQAVGGGEGDHP